MTTNRITELGKPFVKDLKAQGWCKKSSREHNSLRMYNRFDGSVEPSERLGELLSAWLKANKHDVEDEEFGQICKYANWALVTVSGDVFMPNAAPMFVHPESKNCYVNTFRRYKPKTDRSDDIELFHALMQRLFPDDDDRHTCMGWFAHIFQHPDQRPSWHLLCKSPQGTGKGFFVESILTPLLTHTVVCKRYSEVMGRFSQVLKNALLALLDDPKSKSRDTQTELKSILSEERAYVEDKHAAAGMVKTYTRFFLASNEERPLDLDDDERRWFAPRPLKHAVDKEETQRFIASVALWLKEDPTALCRIYNFFMAYDLSDFNPKHVRQTAALREIIGLSVDPVDDFLAAYAAQHTFFRQPDLVEAIEAEGFNRQDHRALAAMLAKLRLGRRQFSVRGVRTSLYCPEGTKQADVDSFFKAPAY